MTNADGTTSGGSAADLAQGPFAGWPLIEIYGVGPDGTCHCSRGRNCNTPGKHPRSNQWQTLERTEPSEYRRGANMGTLTGTPAGFWVLDIDQAGMGPMQDLIREHGLMPQTRVHQTGGGTYHYFFNMPDFDVTNRRGRLPKGIDARGTGGQVVLPPSRSGKGEYTIVRDAPIADAPEWLLTMIRPQGPEPEEASEPAPSAGTKPAVEERDAPRDEYLENYERMVVTREVDRLIAMSKAAVDGDAEYKGEPWDITTYEVACTLMQLARSDWTSLSLLEARDMVMEHAPRDEGFPVSRIEEKLNSAARSTEGKTRAKPTPPVDNSSWLDDIEATPEAPAPSGPAAADQPEPKAERKVHDPDSFFNKEGLKAVELAKAIMAEGPIRWGQNQRWWEYDDRGVWVENRNAVERRGIRILGNRVRHAHTANAEMVIRAYAKDLPIDEPTSRLMNFRNGMLDWRTGILEPHSAEHLSTVQFPHDFTPGAECPRFDAFLDSVMSPDYQQIVWEMIGYLLYSGNPLQIAFLLHGSGENGKGTLIKVITAMLGKENLAHQSLDALNGDKFAAANLFGKIANIAGDIDGTFQESTARFKMLTGEDRFSGEYKYGDSFGFQNWAVPLFSANKIPGSADVSKGYLRRWVNIEFDRQFKGDPIRGLGESMAASDMPGVIAKGLRHLGPLLEQGHFTISGEALKGKDEFAKSLDQTRQWVEEECLEVVDSRVKQDDLYRDYRQWAERNGTGKLKASDFYTRLEGAGFKRAKIKGIRYFEGIAIIEGANSRPDTTVRTGTWLDNVED